MAEAVAQRVIELQHQYEAWTRRKSLEDARWLKSILKAWRTGGK